MLHELHIFGSIQFVLVPDVQIFDEFRDEFLALIIKRASQHLSNVVRLGIHQILEHF